MRWEGVMGKMRGVATAKARKFGFALPLLGSSPGGRTLGT